MPQTLIWGASGGIGSALVRLFKSEGWRVYAAARTVDRAPAEADQVIAFDAGSEFSIQQGAMQVAQDGGVIDAMLYAAGGLVAAPIEKLDRDDWKATLDANLNGAYLTAKASLDLLQPGGQMLFLGAYVEKITLPRMAAYAAAKSALEVMVTVLQKEHRRLKIGLVRLPAVDTPFWNSVPFNLPAGALQPDAVARRVVDHLRAGGGSLDL